MSTSLARSLSGLSDKEIQVLFHALKREADGISGPSELDLAAWRDRQQQLLAGMTRMTDKKKEALSRKLFSSRGEPVPDGATFYAWSRIEARARQEIAIRSIPNAIDLDPPGSHADEYEIGEDGRPTRVWYASYGSNLNQARFLTYIEGGQPPGSKRWYKGCDDPTLPEGDIPIRYAGSRPHFALTSSVWRGGIAFIDAQKGETATGLGRAYNISISQFDGVVAQENGGDPKGATPVPLDEVLTTGRSVTGDGAYETMLHIGDYQGAPVITFTAPFSTRDAMVREGSIQRGKVRIPVRTNKPSASYVRMIGSGLGETFGMDEVAQADYIRGCPGGDRWSRKDLVKVLRGETTDQPVENPAASTAGYTPLSSTATAATSASGKSGPRRATSPVTTTYFSDGEKTDAQLRASIENLRNARHGGGSGAIEEEPSGQRRLGNVLPPTSMRQYDGSKHPGDYYPGVKQYRDTAEQATGVSRWKVQYDKETERIETLRADYERTNGLREAAASDSDAVGQVQMQAKMDQIDAELVTAIMTQAELHRKYRAAAAQRPTVASQTASTAASAPAASAPAVTGSATIPTLAPPEDMPTGYRGQRLEGDAYSGVKTYQSVAEQERGVDVWVSTQVEQETHLSNLRRKRRDLNDEIDNLENANMAEAVQEALRDRYTLDAEIATVEGRVSELRRKAYVAASQRPGDTGAQRTPARPANAPRRQAPAVSRSSAPTAPTPSGPVKEHYPAVEERTTTQWRALGDALQAQHQAADIAYTNAVSAHAAAMSASDWDNAKITEVTQELEKRLAERARVEDRLAEVDAKYEMSVRLP